jgi:hypothetical protein
MISVIVAAFAGWLLGAGWYTAFSKPWLAHSGVTLDAEGKPVSSGPTWVPMAISFVAVLLVAGMMRHAFIMGGVDGLLKGLTSGLGLGAFIAAPWVVMNHAFPGRAPILWAIDGGYAVLGCGLIGAILGAM